MHEIHILLVEDNEGDIILARKALQKARIINRVTVISDGEEAVRFLFRQPPYENEQVPDLVLLDINIPKINGKEVLALVKNDEGLRTIPIVMLTTSDSEMDVLESYRHHANCYIVKPVDFTKFMEVIRAIENFWISIVRLPSLDKPPS